MAGAVPCPNCGRPVPGGQDACGACGALVTPVGGSAAVGEPTPDVSPTAEIAPATEIAPTAEIAPAAQIEPAADLAPAESSAPEPIDAIAAADGIVSGGMVPGAYLVPSSTYRAVSDAAPAASVSVPASAPEAAAVQPAPAWIPPAAPTPPAAPSEAPAASTTTPGRASMLADLPFDAPDELEGWLVALGGGIGVLGFVLPWWPLFNGLEGYFSKWGLAIGHLPMFIALITLAALAILPNRIAPWVRTGVGGMVAGGILFGLVWPFLEGGGQQIGSMLAAMGAFLLIAGGIIAVAPSRRAKTPDGT